MIKGNLSSFLKTRWLLLLVLVVFICCKIPHLSYPFYLDEGWVYAPAVKTMAVNGPSLLPGAIPDKFSRGHPLLFHFLGAVWIKCFGASNVAMHTFPLLLSVLLLISVYEGCRKLFGGRVAGLALLLLATNVLFFVQSSLVLPEVMVVLFTFLSLFFYARDKPLAASFMLFMAFFAKESTLIFGAVIGIDACIALFRRSDSLRLRVLRLVAVALPVLLIALFFVLQKARLGWYLLPEHTELVHTDWNTFYAMFRESVYWAFCADKANYILVFFILLLSVVPAVRQKDVRYLFLCLPVLGVYLLIHKEIAESFKSGVWMALFALLFAAAVYFLLRLNAGLTTSSRRFIILISICFGAYLCFMALSQPAYRYLFVIIVFVLVFLAVCVETCVAASGSYLSYISAAGILAMGAYAFYADEGNTDADLECFHAMKVQQDVARYLEKENAYDKGVVIGCYWAIGHYTDTLQGYLSSNRAFTNLKHEAVSPATDYAIFDNVCGDNGRNEIQKDTVFHLAYRTQEHRSWAEVYKRNR